MVASASVDDEARASREVAITVQALHVACMKHKTQLEAITTLEQTLQRDQAKLEKTKQNRLNTGNRGS